MRRGQVPPCPLTLQSLGGHTHSHVDLGDGAAVPGWVGCGGSGGA